MVKAWHQNIKRSPASERTSVEGFVFDSKGELKRWNELRLLERAGEIYGLHRQAEFVLALEGRPVLIRSARYKKGRQCVYTADFVYHGKDGKWIYEEYKGHDDGESRLRRAVVETIYRIEITVTGPAASKTPRIARGEAASTEEQKYSDENRCST